MSDTTPKSKILVEGVTPLLPNCLKNFYFNFLTDLDIPFGEQLQIGLKLEAAVRVYNDNKSQTSLNNIADELYNCVLPYLNHSAIITSQEIGSLVIYFSIITAIILVVVVVIIATLKSTNKAATIGLVCGVCLAYIIVGWLVVQNTFYVISNSILEAENNIISCIYNGVLELESFISKEESAIDKAFCAYP